ncbi:MAG TPA: sodium:proton antiporter [Candidatus Omnitrophica bacterium]|nr:MAG: hypothetical protein A2Z81_09005 [Omnitrophica WOR_2 bacterium GWA2_45_18]HBR14293.1 sodium:proton antiporter [Candidatus Omnitrophota bacterium]
MEKFLLDLSVLLVFAAILSYFAVMLRQPIIIAYIISGILIGPWGWGFIKNVEFIEMVSHLGITLLLFLVGLCLHPQKLLSLFKKTTIVTLGSSLASFLIGFSFALVWRFSMIESVCIGFTLMFSSTILAVKLLPTTKLHHGKMGASCIGVLIMQDLLAVSVLAFIRCFNSPDGATFNFFILSFKLVVFIGALFLVEYFVIRKIMTYVDRLHEALFVLGLAWCFGIASISNSMGLFFETGAFFAGVVLASHPIALFISEKLKPLRDFFLVLFFFTLGAKLNFFIMKGILIPALLLAGILIWGKPWIFKKLFMLSGEEASFAKEAGVRLGQLSEFSLLIAILAFDLGHISERASQFIQFVTIITFIVSSYWVVFNYPTPIGTSEKLIKD